MSNKYKNISQEDPLFEGFESSYESTTTTAQLGTSSNNGVPPSSFSNSFNIANDQAETPQVYFGGSDSVNTSKTDLRFMAVVNPVNSERRRSSIVDVQDLFKRVDSLRSMRPLKLIGTCGSLVDWPAFRKPEKSIQKLKHKNMKKYYEEQNEYIDRYHSVDVLLDAGVHMRMIENYGKNDVISSRNEPLGAPADIDVEGERALGHSQSQNSGIVDMAINMNFLINFILLIGKLIAAYLSNSMSIIASLVDSVLDLLSTFIIFFANKFASSKSSMFPIGRKRLEPLGVLVFSVIIIVSFSQVLISSVSKLLDGDHEIVSLTQTAASIMVFTILIKIICYLWCKNIDNSSVQALSEDAKTDIVFNFFSIIFPIVGSSIGGWWVDSFGASVLCVYVIVQWAAIAFEHITNLSGASASKEDYQEILYMIARFSDNIHKIKNFRTYHVGDLINVEVDIVILNPDLELKDCHDLGESLQYAIETLPFVERCFVHLDYKEINFSGHINK